MTITIIGIGAAVIVISVVLLAFMFIKSNQVNLTKKTEDKPEWMRSTPPPETVEATTASQGGVGLYHQEEGERLASPFAEQLEDILKARLAADPTLKDFTIDLATGKGYELEIWVNGSKYTSIDELPSEKLKSVFREAVDEWDSRK
ncbi:MAG: hypothetical protein QY332_19670 [Anaerolineales bacterium]|nr:MAG: hypothetical protein QY332_19670 [Anaerolineales bacterium]